MEEIFKDYIKSQTGAALILVLFVVLFLTIVGTLLLNSTTYSMKSIVQNRETAEEFYLLEGALDLVLYNLYETRNYNGGMEPLLDSQGRQAYAPDGITPLYIHKKGIYFFLEDYFANNINDPKYKGVFGKVNIDDQEIQFQLSDTRNGNIYELELLASLINNPTISRKIKLSVTVPPKPVENYSGGTISRGDYIQSPTNLDDNIDIHHKQKHKFVGKYLGGIIWKDKMKNYGLSIPSNLTTDLTPNTSIKTSPAYFNTITATNKTTITIPKDKIVYANSLNWNGNNRTLIVEGTLIVNSFDIQGSSKVEIKSEGTIIANTFKFWSNSTEIKFPSVTEGSGSGGGTPRYTSDVNWTSNNYDVENYKTVR